MLSVRKNVLSVEKGKLSAVITRFSHWLEGGMAYLYAQYGTSEERKAGITGGGLIRNNGTTKIPKSNRMVGPNSFRDSTRQST